jgi:hypothetical protein
MTVGLSLLSWVIPNEVVPRVVVDGGRTIYVLQSLQEAILWPAGAALVLLFMLGYGYAFRTQSVAKKSRVAQSGVGRFFSFAGIGIQYVVLGACLLMLGLVFLDTIVLKPLTRFRQVEVSDQGLVCQSLFDSQEVAFADLVTIDATYREVTRKSTDYRDCQLLLHCRGGVMIRSVSVNLPISDARLSAYTEVMEACVTDLGSRQEAVATVDLD